jgi:gamma-glutamyltranspeptidase/glutathione hydrolase
MAGLGGDGFWLIADDDGDVRGINASGPAAESATIDYYESRGHSEIPDRGDASALTVPGAVDGWRLAHEQYGKIAWSRLFEDAIAHAREGIPVTANLSRWIALDADILSEDPQASKTYLNDGDVPEPGSVLPQPHLAESFEAVAQLGPRDGFYEGEIAEEICKGLDNVSPLSESDFANYSAEWVDPISVDYRSYTAYSLPPNTQGVAALQILGLLDGFDVASWGDSTADYYHHMAEAVKIAFADRDAWVTDPNYTDVPIDSLLSDSYLERRRGLINSNKSLPPSPKAGMVSEDTTAKSNDAGGDTCYLSVVDNDGLAVSMIQSIYYDFGSGIVAGDTGIIPQNRGSFFSMDSSHINSLEPGKRVFHTLIPSLLTRNGEPWLVYGTMGGEGQPQTQAALVTRIVDFGYDVQTAIESPRWLFGRTWGEESKSLSLEGRIPDSVFNELQRRGQPVAVGRDYDDSMGHAAAIKISSDGILEGGADPRSDGSAIGY